MLFGFSPVGKMIPIYQSSDKFCWKYELQRELSVVWNTGGKRLE